MDIEKLKQIKQLVEECIREYEGEESDEGEMTSSEDGEMESMPSAGERFSDSGNDKIKMAAALMKRGR